MKVTVVLIQCLDVLRSQSFFWVFFFFSCDEAGTAVGPDFPRFSRTHDRNCLGLLDWDLG